MPQCAVLARIGGPALIAILAAGCSASSSPTPSDSVGGSGSSAATLYQKAVSDAQAARGLRYSVLLSSTAGVTIHLSGDVGRASGLETETIKQAGKSSSVTVELIGNVLYATGSAAGLASIPLGVTNVAAAAKFAGRWIAVPPTTPGFAALTSALTLASVLGVVKLDHLSHRPGGPYKVDGQAVVELNATQASTSGSSRQPSACVVSVSMALRPLPVQVTCTQAGGGATVTITFFDWLPMAAISPPSPTVPLSKVLASQPAIAH